MIELTDADRAAMWEAHLAWNDATSWTPAEDEYIYRAGTDVGIASYPKRSWNAQRSLVLGLCLTV
jgi:hypothetical protein